MKKWIAIFIVIILVLAGFIIWKFDYLPNDTDDGKDVPEGIITGFTIEKPVFVVTAENLSRVEIVGRSAISGRGEVPFGLATRGSDDGTEQVWKLLVPQEPILLTEIFARGYDLNGREVETVSLPYFGATNVYRALWKDAPLEIFELRVPGSHTTKNGVTVTLVHILEDSRCPTDVTCIQAGRVVVELEVSDAKDALSITLASANSEYDFHGNVLTIENVVPEPRSDKLPELEDYMVTFSLISE